MVGAERFIEKLAEQGVLSESIIKRLRDKVAGSSSVPSPRALAQFLVDKGHLTREQADEALAASAPPRKPRKKRAEPSDPNLRTIKPERTKKKRAKKSAGDDPFSVPEEKPSTKSGGGKGKKKYKKKKKGENEFDTPLMLLGGGGLVIILLGIGFFLYLFFTESGDERLEAARTAYEAGSYAQAIQDYEIFCEKFESHEGYSQARVTLGIARIRQIAGSNSEQALKRAQTELPEIEDEREFASIQEDLASVLPTMAKDLAARADAAEELEQIKKYVALTEEALVLSTRTNYVPSRLRNKQELNQIKEVLARIALREQALESLAETLDTMQQAVEAGDTKTAYAAHAGFVKAHPEKAEDEELVAAVAAASQAEKKGIQFVEERTNARTTEAETAVSAAVATADQRRQAEAPTRGVAVVRYQNAAYAFDRRNGQLLWRRPVGVSLQDAMPVMVGDDCLLLDAKREELVRVNATTGKLVWRSPLKDQTAQPVLLGDKILAAGKSGKLHIVEASSGSGLGYVQFAQPLRSAPAVNTEAQRIYLVGEHSSVYTLDAKDLSCLGVYYLGHAKGTVEAPPSVVLNRLVIFENDGAATSSLHLMGTDSEGVVDRTLLGSDSTESRLPGLVTGPAEVFGKRFAVMTNSGHIGVYEVSSEDTETSLTLLGTRAAKRQPRSNLYSAVINQELWVASTGLARYSIQPAGSRLPVRDVKDQFRGDTFVHPLEVADGVLVHVRRRRGRAGATVAATDLKTGAVYWETDIAAPASGPPVASQKAGGLLYATATGKVFLIDQLALSSGVTSTVVGGDGNTMLDVGQATDSRALYASGLSGQALGIDDRSSSLQPLELPGAMTEPPIAFGEGWLALLAIGQIAYVDGVTGETLAAPFQPQLAPGGARRWRAAFPSQIDGKPSIVVSDGESTLYTLQVATSPSPHLAPIAEAKLSAGQLTSRVAATDSHTAVATSEGQLLIYDTATLEALSATPMKSSVVWGPYAASDHFLLADASGKLTCLDPATPEEPKWSLECAALELLASPSMESDDFVLTHRDGALTRRRLSDGEVVSQADTGQGLALKGHTLNGRIAYSATDGALLLVQPAKEW